MSPSKFRVTVQSADPLAEVTIVDSRYSTRARGFGRVECRLPRGLYVARARSGDTTQQRKVRITDRDVVVDDFTDRDEMRSSAPPADPSFDQARLSTINAAPVVTPNANAWMFLALRRTDETEQTTGLLPVQSAAAFELYSLNGALITSIDSQALIPTPSGHWVAALRLAAGWYALSIPGDTNSRIRISLYVGDRYSPSVFIELRARRSEPPRPDLDRLLVSYDELESAIFRNNDRMRAIELARRSLVLGRNLLTPALMRILYDQKFHDPMLGLLAAHLLLSDSKGDKPFEEVVINTGEILNYPQHPDLVIIRALGRQRGWWKRPPLPGDSDPLVAPPLLRASWDGMVRLKERSGEVVATESLRSVASSLVRSSIWVLWRTRPARATRSSSALRGRSNRKTDALLNELVDRLRLDPNLASAFRQEIASERYEGDVLSRTIARAALRLTDDPDRTEVPRGYVKRLANVLSVPVPLVADEINTISEIIGERQRSRS